ncbi:hypothetical protein Tco_0457839 [Tanacetum coccineum]|uniref:Uncharacterized protein n=1 Tax=Tanacetum coccineum TaxID=301880 RepID=A0ABQ5AN41_9ASTR
MAKTIKTMNKGLKSKIAKHEGTKPTTKNKEKDQDHSLETEESNLIDLIKECHQMNALRGDCYLKILEPNRKFDSALIWKDIDKYAWPDDFKTA